MAVVAGQNGLFAWAVISQKPSQTKTDSYNVTSITDNGVGRTIFTFSTAAANNDYAVVCSAGNRNNTTTSARAQNYDGAFTTTSCRIRNFVLNSDGDATYDDSYVSISIIADH